MRILHVIPNLRKGGAERLAINICQEIQENGHEVCLVTFEEHNDYQFITKSINHKIIPSRVDFSILGKDRYEISELQQFINSYNPDVIHAHLFYAEAVLSGITSHSVKYFLHMHDNMKQLSKWNGKGIHRKSHWTNLYERKIVLKKMLERNTTVIAISDDSFHFSKKNLPHNTEVILLNNAIDVERFKNESTWEKRPDRIVMIGSLVEKKGHDLALRILAEMHVKNLRFHLDLLGDGPLRNDVMSLAESLQLTHFVHFHGNVDHPEKFLENAQIYLHTAKYEPFGLVLLEAMASGTPVVCTDGIGNRDLVEDAVNGLMHLNRNPKELANRIEDLLSDEKARRNLISNAMNFVMAYTIQAFTKRLLQFYQVNKK